MDEEFEDNHKFDEFPPLLPEFTVFESPPTPCVDIDFEPDPNDPLDDSLMCPNTPTKHASSIQVWWPAGPIRWLETKNPKRCDKY